MSRGSAFNACHLFIDRHVDEGREGDTAIRTVQGEEVTYGELAAHVSRCGNALLGSGLGHGDRLLMIVRDAPEFFYLFWGAIRAGVVPVPLNVLLRADDFSYAIDDSEADGVAFSTEFSDEVLEALSRAAHRPRLVLDAREGLDDAMSAADSELEPATTGPLDDGFWLYSSGTTGRPKGVVHRQRDIEVTCRCYAEGVLGISQSDVCFSAAKLFFAYGLGNAMTFPLWAGATSVLDARKPTPEGTLETIERFRPTLFFGVPTLYAAQLHALERAPRELSSLRQCVSAGEALPPDLLRRWSDATGLEILDGIGSTEALHIFVSNRPGAVRPGTSGQVVPGYEARVLDDGGAEVPVGESGQLAIRGDSLLARYWNQPEKTVKTLVDGWLRTGDTYAREQDGYFRYLGRGDDMLKVGGIWCSPFEIEAKLVEHPAVLEAAVVGRSDEAGLIKPEAWIVLADGESASSGLAEALLQHCKKGLARYKYPRWFQFVDALPKTATGKIQRFKLRGL